MINDLLLHAKCCYNSDGLMYLKWAIGKGTSRLTGVLSQYKVRIYHDFLDQYGRFKL